MERSASGGFPGRAKHNQVWRTANWHMAVMLTVTAIVVADIVLPRFLAPGELNFEATEAG